MEINENYSLNNEKSGKVKSNDKDNKVFLLKYNDTTANAIFNIDDDECLQALHDAENGIMAEDINTNEKIKKTSRIKQDIDIEKYVRPDLEDSFENITKKVTETYKNNKEVYEIISDDVYEKIGVRMPTELICAIHYRESENNFNCYFQNGDPLGKPTEHEPKGLLYYTFEESAEAAILDHYDYFKNDICTTYGLENDFSTMSSCLEFAECYNKNKDYSASYVYSGTSVYKDLSQNNGDIYNEAAYDKRPGVAYLVNELMKNN